MLIDTHAHLNSFEDLKSVLDDSSEFKVREIISISTDLISSERNIEIANAFENVFSCVGIHPCDIERFKLEDLDRIEQLGGNQKNKAIGEIGLDFFYNKDNAVQQLNFFDSQIEIAEKLHVPFVIHSRESYKELIDFLRGRKPRTEYVVHCYTGDKEIAKSLLNMGSYISFTGIITFKKSDELREVVDYIPQDRIMVETDSPYLSPEPERGKKNFPKNLIYIVKCVSQIKKRSFLEIANQLRDNSVTFFKL
jgi:TatD DNase family protein